MGYCPHSAHLAITRPGNNRAVAGFVAANGLKKTRRLRLPIWHPTKQVGSFVVDAGPLLGWSRIRARQTRYLLGRHPTARPRRTWEHERPRALAGNFRLLPPDRSCGVDLRPAR